ncbi:AbrB/MazE/SpoVT family DNA-binding domain-containing protein [Candidatus Woesearchaeota archaeon]|nr:AbrB/MazE/SpoVT family DNA-binding domain-containing protein [Candidatus Woesearchaeota archaeon]
MTLKELKTVKITSKGQIAIPKDIRKMEGFKEGSKLALLAFNDHVEIRPLEYLKKADLRKEGISNYIMSESSLAKEWLTEEEDEAWKNL